MKKLVIILFPYLNEKKMNFIFSPFVTVFSIVIVLMIVIFSLKICNDPLATIIFFY